MHHSDPPIPAADARIERLVLLATLDAYPELYSRLELIAGIAWRPGESHPGGFTVHP